MIHAYGGNTQHRYLWCGMDIVWRGHICILTCGVACTYVAVVWHVHTYMWCGMYIRTYLLVVWHVQTYIRTCGVACCMRSSVRSRLPLPPTDSCTSVSSRASKLALEHSRVPTGMWHKYEDHALALVDKTLTSLT